MRLPIAESLADFKKTYDFMEGKYMISGLCHCGEIMCVIYFFYEIGNKNDIFWGETYTDEKTERWCETDTPLHSEMSVDGFQLLRDRSFLYSQKERTPKYKLHAIDAELMTSNIKVNYFYCEPKDN
jgi:hypothetical protein